MPIPEGVMAAMISAGASMAGAGIQTATNFKSLKKAKKYAKYTAGLQEQYNISAEQRAQQYQLDAWNRENEYNDPSAVRDRLLKAGYNPYLMDMSGTSSMPSGVGASAPTVDNPNSIPFQQENPFAGAVTSFLQSMHLKNALKKTQLESDELDLKREQQEYEQDDTDRKFSLERDKMTWDKFCDAVQQDLSAKDYELRKRGVDRQQAEFQLAKEKQNVLLPIEMERHRANMKSSALSYQKDLEDLNLFKNTVADKQKLSKLAAMTADLNYDEKRAASTIWDAAYGLKRAQIDNDYKAERAYGRQLSNSVGENGVLRNLQSKVLDLFGLSEWSKRSGNGPIGSIISAFK